MSLFVGYHYAIFVLFYFSGAFAIFITYVLVEGRK